MFKRKLITETYKVKEGDTLLGIAGGDWEKVKRIMKLNPQIKNCNEIFAEEILIVGMCKIKDIKSVRRNKRRLKNKDVEWL